MAVIRKFYSDFIMQWHPHFMTSRICKKTWCAKEGVFKVAKFTQVRKSEKTEGLEKDVVLNQGVTTMSPTHTQAHRQTNTHKSF